MDATIEQVFTFFIFDGDNFTINRSFREYVTIQDIIRILEGEYE